MITKVINPVMVALKLPPLLGKIHPVFHSNLLKSVEVIWVICPPHRDMWTMIIMR